jgi:outer membrane protein OmpA-like peptidoglycan-associated protein/Tol biopolymer transport system component
MRTNLFSFFIFILTLQTVFAQFPYSSTSKKAIKLFEKGQKAPTELRNPNTGALNYQEGILLLNAAIDKDPEFWEAYLLKAEFLEFQRKYTEAAACYQKALTIDPTHSISGSTHYFLAVCLLTIGEYKEALQTIDVFLRNPNANEKLQAQAYQIRAYAEFSVEAVKNAKPFAPKNAGEGINTPFAEYYPTLTVDGQQLLFTRRLPMIQDGHQDEQEDFYVSSLDQKSDVWTLAQPMPSNINTTWNEGAPTISGDGKTIIFVACTDPSGVNYGADRTGKGSCDLFITQKINGRWSTPINLPGAVNTANWETQPSLSADGQTLYFIRAIRSRDGRANSDIYASNLLPNGKWSEAERLPNVINTTSNEESVQIHPDGKTLYFASRGHIGLGGSDLFMSQKDAQGNWGKPINLGFPINTHFDENSLLVSAQGDIAFFASDRQGGYGNLDIYWFELPKELQANQTYYFEGTAFDALNLNKLAAHIQLTDLSNGQIIFDGFADSFDGKITVPLPIDHQYAVLVNHPGYHPFSLNFDFTRLETSQNYTLNMPLNPVNSTAENILNNVFFDLAKASLRPESKVELSNLSAYLKRNPSIKIEIQGHTDSQGDTEQNLILSNSRARAVADFLVQEGIAAERLTYKGYGSGQPLITDAQIAQLKNTSEIAAAHQKNRRTSYKILP